MVLLQVYDASPVAWSTRIADGSNFIQTQLRDALNCTALLPDYVLLRTIHVPHYLGKIVTNKLEKLIEVCAKNGHDRTNPDEWGSIPDDVTRKLIGEGYKGHHVLWVTPFNLKTQPNPRSRGANLLGGYTGILVINGEAYDARQEEMYVYAQRDGETRRKGMVTTVHFD